MLPMLHTLPKDKPLLPEHLLQYAKDSATWFLRKQSSNTYIEYLDGYSIDDIAMEAVCKALRSKVQPKSKTYVAQTVLSVISNLSIKGKLDHLSNTSSQVSQEIMVPLLTAPDILCNLKASLESDDYHLFIAAYESQLTIHDIAVLHGVSERTIKRRLSELSLIIEDFLGN